jgi:branched-chain amino acid transport system permease protein
LSALGRPLNERLPEALKDAAIAAFIALALFVFLIGIRTVDKSGVFPLQGRPWLLASAVGAVFAGRLALNLFWWGNPETSDSLAKALAPVSLLAERSMRWLAPALIVFAITLPFMPFADRYILDVSIMVLTYIMLGWGLNVVVGLAGLLDLGYVAFYAVGAYSYALISTHFGLSFWISLPLAGLLAGLWGIILGFPVLRLRGDYLAIVTLAFGEMIRIVLINWYSLTNGPDGISRIPRPTFFGLPLKRTGDVTFHKFFGLE